MKVQPGDLPSSDVSSIVGPTHSRSASLVSSFELVYDLAPSAPLPAIDISRSVRSVLLSERLNKRWTRLMGKTQVGIFFIYNTALVLNLVIICTNHWVVRWTAITNQVIMYYAILAQISLMRVDILQLLLYTYEFWFITVVNCISTVIMTFYVPDLRGLTVWGMWIGNELVAIIDAQIVFQRGLMLSAIPPVAFTAGVVCCVLFNSMEGANNFALSRVNGYELDAADVLINGYSNMLILMLRNLYRRREAMKEHGQNSSVIQCITYRCPL
ncbi:hypothetical protein Poli38472_001778 [Pythium oligandrum]|uniref:Transmembrane protein n=1 Tax=Pythium oligandrum TaxID=41045 RepID=A0A8K1CTG4_PYTOL|nr:hypothetical protein Poli38472_001778 [Pythium oligandrum]|eukprot:TMW69622.1 hypothetical protein Poli38472_001778 [Pythium oligandrum]